MTESQQHEILIRVQIEPTEPSEPRQAPPLGQRVLAAYTRFLTLILKALVGAGAGLVLVALGWLLITILSS